MNRRIQVATGLMWLFLPLTAMRYWLAWDRLPARLATHFDAGSRPNGWMTRQDALTFGLGMTVLFLLILTVVAYALRRQKASDAGSWAVLGLIALVVVMIYQGNSSIIGYNLTGQPISIFTPLLLLPAAFILIAIYLVANRGGALPEAPLIAEETHSSPIIGLLLLIPLVVELAVFANTPNPQAGWIALPLGLFFVGFAAFAWSGFQYRFSHEGLEIRSLGVRLRSIPAAEIRDYCVAGWRLWRGYGIRGVGRCRAYVWGNKVVHIKTTQGDVFLGHNDPERIIGDLNTMRQLVH